MKRFLTILLGNIIGFIAAGIFLAVNLYLGLWSVVQMGNDEFPWALVILVGIWVIGMTLFEYVKPK